MATGCTSCQSENKKQDAPKEQVAVGYDYDGVVQDFTAGVAHIQALHRLTMFKLANGETYEWRNSQVYFNDTIRKDNIDDLHITDIIDVFFYWNASGPWVQYINTNVTKGTIIPKPIQDVWIEDDELDNCEIKLSAEDALQRLKEWNGEIPSNYKCMVLRRPVGVRNCNAQWVLGTFGNPLFIDAVTGDITDWCPAFPIPNVAGPLGEWP